MIGNVGLGFGVSGGGACDYPTQGNVRDGTIYAFGSMVGTLIVSPTAYVVLPPASTRVLSRIAPQTASQGVSIWDLIRGMRNYILLVSGLENRFVRLWLQPTRPQLSGADTFLWYRPTLDVVNKSVGPGRWGNKTDLKVDVHFITRNFVDESQVDERRAEDFYNIYFKLESAFQGKNLFDAYQLPAVIQGVWHPPEPQVKAVSLTVEPMYLEPVPVPDRTQKEEGTLETVFTVVLPAVLALTVP